MTSVVNIGNRAQLPVAVLFLAQSKATFFSATAGYLRVRATLDGRFSGSAS